jgi:hypothetical protein
VCGVDSIERQIQSNALWWGGREVYVAEKYMAELSEANKLIYDLNFMLHFCWVLRASIVLRETFNI